MKRTKSFDSLVIFLLSCILILPLFRREYVDNWKSIESTFIADARMLENNLPHPGWQPLWYCGTRTDYIYPPALRYGTALIAKVGGVSTARGYHIYTALLYAFGIVAVYWLVIAGSGSRVFAWLATAATALISPSFLIFPIFRHDSGYWVPQRLHVLTSYGEGPHISALCVLPAALAATFVALRGRKPWMIALAGVLCAFVVANNFYGATALAVFFPIVAWAVWTGDGSWRVWARAAGIVAMAWGFSAFWLTPSFLRITVLNLKWVSQPGNTWSMVTLLVVTVLFCAGSFLWARKRPERSWTVFVIGAAVILTLNVVGFQYFGFRVTGEPGRLVPELDLALILVFFEGIRALWNRPALRIPAAVLVALAFAPALVYLRHYRSPFPKAGPLEDRYEYQTTKWVHDNLPGARVLPSGTVRFWFDAWFDNAQPDGGSMQGMLNQHILDATWQIMQGDDPRMSMLWMQALGTDAVVAPDNTSREPYHDFKNARKFQGALPAIYDDQQGTVIYKTPRVYAGIGRVVNRDAFDALPSIRGGDDREGLTRYASIIEDPAQPEAQVTWRGFDEADVQTTVPAGRSVLVQETFDPAWHAYENGKPLPIRTESTMSFMLLDVPQGTHRITMRFETPAENRAGQGMFFVTLGVAGLLVFRTRRDKTGSDRPAARRA